MPMEMRNLMDRLRDASFDLNRVFREINSLLGWSWRVIGRSRWLRGSNNSPLAAQGLQSIDDPVPPEGKLGVVGSRRIRVHEHKRVRCLVVHVGLR